MFASNINYQFSIYFSYKADPKATAVESFTQSLSQVAFPEILCIPTIFSDF